MRSPHVQPVTTARITFMIARPAAQVRIAPDQHYIIGYYCTYGAKDLQEMCPSGMYSNYGAQAVSYVYGGSYCMPCPEGYYCSRGSN